MSVNKRLHRTIICQKHLRFLRCFCLYLGFIFLGDIMKIQKIMQQTTKPNFGAGITNLYSNFDGTYIPQKYNHDSVCNHSPQVNKDEFQGTMEKTWELFWKLKGDGKESKFNFAITTGRNLNEFNYFLNKLRSQDLWIPFPDKVITGNGEDEFYSNIKDIYIKNANKILYF